MNHDDRGSALHRCLTCQKSECEHDETTLHRFVPEPFRCAIHFGCYAERPDCIDAIVEQYLADGGTVREVIA